MQFLLATPTCPSRACVRADTGFAFSGLLRVVSEFNKKATQKSACAFACVRACEFVVCNYSARGTRDAYAERRYDVNENWLQAPGPKRVCERRNDVNTLFFFYEHTRALTHICKPNGLSSSWHFASLASLGIVFAAPSGITHTHTRARIRGVGITRVRPAARPGISIFGNDIKPHWPNRPAKCSRARHA